MNILKQTIPYTREQLDWHLQNNVIGLDRLTINHILAVCEKVNNEELFLEDEAAPKCGVTIYEMLTDLKIEFNDL